MREAIPVARNRKGKVIAYFTPNDMTYWEAEQRAALTHTAAKTVHCDKHNAHEFDFNVDPHVLEFTFGLN